MSVAIENFVKAIYKNKINDVKNLNSYHISPVFLSSSLLMRLRDSSSFVIAGGGFRSSRTSNLRPSPYVLRLNGVNQSKQLLPRTELKLKQHPLSYGLRELNLESLSALRFSQNSIVVY